MPKGVYRKKTKRGWMHFRDGKLISKSSYLRSKGTKRSTRKGGVRKTARRAYVRKNNPKRSKYMKGIPHPSITGMASGLAIAAYLNQGTETATATGTTLGTTPGGGGGPSLRTSIGGEGGQIIGGKGFTGGALNAKNYSGGVFNQPQTGFSSGGGFGSSIAPQLASAPGGLNKRMNPLTKKIEFWNASTGQYQ